MRKFVFNVYQLTIINFCSVISSTVKKLTNKLPDLLSKIESINQQLLPLGNISDNVDRIRELIQQARDAANKVGVSPHCQSLRLFLWEVSTVIKKGKVFIYTETGCLSFSNPLVVWHVKVDFLLSSFKSVHYLHVLNDLERHRPEAVSSHWVYAGRKKDSPPRPSCWSVIASSRKGSVSRMCQCDTAQHLLSYYNLKVRESTFIEDGGMVPAIKGGDLNTGL